MSGSISAANRPRMSPGPTSIQRSIAAGRATVASVNRTGAVTWRQSSSRRSARPAGSRLVTVESNWADERVERLDGEQVGQAGTAPATISGEWKACPTGSRITVIPRARALVATRSTASAGPETTVCRGAL